MQAACPHAANMDDDDAASGTRPTTSLFLFATLAKPQIGRHIHNNEASRYSHPFQSISTLQRRQFTAQPRFVLWRLILEECICRSFAFFVSVRVAQEVVVSRAHQQDEQLNDQDENYCRPDKYLPDDCPIHPFLPSSSQRLPQALHIRGGVLQGGPRSPNAVAVVESQHSVRGAPAPPFPVAASR